MIVSPYVKAHVCWIHESCTVMSWKIQRLSLSKIFCLFTKDIPVIYSKPSRHFWDCPGWKSGLSIVIWLPLWCHEKFKDCYLVRHSACLFKTSRSFIQNITPCAMWEVNHFPVTQNVLFIRCQWGPAIAHWVGILTEMYAIHMERYILVVFYSRHRFWCNGKSLTTFLSYKMYFL